MKSRSWRMFSVVLVLALTLLFAGCEGKGGGGGDTAPIGKALTSYATCDDLEAALAAAPVVDHEPGAVMGGAQGGDVVATAAPEARENVPPDRPREVGEADIVKQDGSYVYVLHSSGKLYIFAAQDRSSIAETAALDLGAQPTAMVVHGNIAAIVGPASSTAETGFDAATQVLLVDISDRAHPAIAREIRIDGYYADSRLVGSTFHVITSEWLGFASQAAPKPGDLQPRVIDARIKGAERQNSLVATDCSRIYMPDPMRFDAVGGSFQIEATRIESIDISALDGAVVSTTAIGASPTVAASPRRLYLADWDWVDDKGSLNIFDIESDPTKAVYVGSAQFEGQVLNQFSIDEFEGMVRVATTVGRNTPGSDDNDNRVFVFQQQGSAVNLMGSVSGIAPGESIWSARFAGDKAFLVTYLTVDPLITIDLSDPTHPAKAGELEVPGVSTYLTKMDESHLLAVGLSMADGGAWNGGVALSIFDVADFSHPILDHRVVIGEESEWTYSEANSTHKAFAYFPEERLVAIPVNHAPNYVGGDVAISAQSSMDYGSRLYVFKVDAGQGFEQVAAIDHSDLIPAADREVAEMYGLAMRRALLLNGLFFSVSDYAIKAALADDPANALFGQYLSISQPTGQVGGNQ